MQRFHLALSNFWFPLGDLSAKADKIMSVGKTSKDDMSMAKAEKEPAMSVAAKTHKEDLSVPFAAGKAGKEMSVGKASKVMSV